jgi:predicted transcriptional regulator
MCRRKDEGIGYRSLPVCDKGHLAGVITDRDITIRAVAKGSDPATVTVREVMTPEVLCCFEDDEVEEAARIMRENQVRRILVLNEANELVGITSLGELATITGDRLMAGETLESVSEESQEMQEGEVEEEGDGESNAESGNELPHETRVTGLLHDRESAKQAIEELKGAGFTDKSILIAMHDDSARESFLRETLARAISEEQMPRLPDLSSGQILVMIEAEERVDDAVNILNRHHAITAGVRITEA